MFKALVTALRGTRASGDWMKTMEMKQAKKISNNPIHSDPLTAAQSTEELRTSVAQITQSMQKSYSFNYSSLSY